MKPPRYQLIVDVIPISQAALRALTAGYHYNQRMREAMYDQSSRLREAAEMAVAKARLAAHQ